MKLAAMLTGITGGILGFINGMLYFFFTFVITGTDIMPPEFAFQYPSPIYESSYWFLGAGAILLSVLGLVGGILSNYKPKGSSILMLACSILGLLLIFTGYLFNSLLFFAGGILALLDHRKEMYNLDLKKSFLPFNAPGGQGNSMHQSSGANNSPAVTGSNFASMVQGTAGSNANPETTKETAEEEGGGISQETVRVGDFVEEENSEEKK